MDIHYPVHDGLLQVSLGALRREYIPFFMKGVNDPEIVRGVLLRPPVTLEAELAWYDGTASKKGEVVFAILLQQKDEAGAITGYQYIGHTGLHNMVWPDGHAISGTIIAEKSYLGKGYGTEAKLLLLHEAFHNRGLRKVCSHVKAFNGNSWGHLLSCGYQETGRKKHHHFDNGRFVDSVDFEVFREEFESIWSSYQGTKSLPRLTTEQRAFLKKETSTA